MEDDDFMEKINRVLAGEASQAEVEELLRKGYEEALGCSTARPSSGCEGSENPISRAGDGEDCRPNRRG